VESAERGSSNAGDSPFFENRIKRAHPRSVSAEEGGLASRKNQGTYSKLKSPRAGGSGGKSAQGQPLRKGDSVFRGDEGGNREGVPVPSSEAQGREVMNKKRKNAPARWPNSRSDPGEGIRKEGLRKGEHRGRVLQE